MREFEAILLDRDGVINRELGHAVLRWDEFEFLPQALEALAQLARLPVPIVVVSNQSAIGRGWTSLETVRDIHERMLRAVREAGGRIDDVLICPHAPEAGCACRKPLPGLLLEAARKFKFEPRRAIMIGDMPKDVEAAQAVGARAFLIRLDRQRPPGVGPEFPVAGSLWEVVQELTRPVA